MSNDELQKAIDDITSSEAQAADTANAGAPTVSPSDEMGGVSDLNMPEVPAEPVAVPDGALADAPSFELPTEPPVAIETTPVEAPVTDEATSAEAPVQPVEPVTPPVTPEAISPEPVKAESEIKMPKLSEDGPKDPELEEVENSALKELYPLLAKMNVNAREKFDICMKVIVKTGEKGATQAALSAAKEISDETERGECLINLVEAIDKMD